MTCVEDAIVSNELHKTISVKKHLRMNRRERRQLRL